MKNEYLSLPPQPDTTLTNVDAAFPATVRHLMPCPDDIPRQYPRRGEWEKFQADWFFKGLEGCSLTARPGVDLSAALRHLQCIQGSYEPKHQDKAKAVAWLASLWLDEAVLGL